VRETERENIVKERERKVCERLRDREKKIVRDRERKDCKRQRKK
jgi:hypothetical protein